MSDEVKFVQSGESTTTASLRALMADAERYRWLNRQDNFLIHIDDKPVRLKCGGEVLDRWIDARIDEERSRGDKRD